MRKIFLLFWFAISLQSCYDASITEETVETTSNEFNAKIVEIAKNAICDFSQGRSESSLKVSSVIPCTVNQILKESQVGRSLSDTIFYIVNFENKQGCVMVADYSQTKEAVAIIPDQNLSTEEVVEDATLKYFLEFFVDSYHSGHLGMTYSLDDVIDILDPGEIQAVKENEEDWKTVTTYPTLIKAEWGTGNPYNLYCFTKSGKQAAAGSLDVAIAQLLSYYKHPEALNNKKIDWTNLSFSYPSKREHAEAVATLIYELGCLNDTQYDEDKTWNYYIDVSLDGTPSAPPCPLDILSDSFVYTYESFENEIKMIHNISEFGPALMSGKVQDEDGNTLSRRTWVIDGALAKSRKVNGVYEIRFFYYCNWGMNGKNNGYFISTAFAPGDPYFTYDHELCATYFIQKK